jgi:CheY-like chemotaxis protein
MLEELGYRVTARTDSRQALEIFQARPDEFDLVITDQTMPGLTGLDLVARILHIRADTPIILCTGYSSIISVETAKAKGVREFILKPVSQRNLAQTIRKALGRA